MVLAQPYQGLELPGAIVQRLQPPQPMASSAQVVGQLVAVTRVGLGSGGAPTGPGGVQGGGMDSHDRVAGGQQSVHDQPAGLLDRHRQLLRPASASQPQQRVGQSCLGVWRCPVVDHRAGIVDHGHVMGGAGPVPPDKHRWRSS